MKPVSLILACTYDGGIGYKNIIPWHIPEELKKFATITKCVNDKTKKNAVIMGRRTWQSISKPLPGRINIVISTREFLKRENSDNLHYVSSIAEALNFCEKSDYIEKAFIIGGASIYDEFIWRGKYDIYLSVLFYNDYKTDSKIDINMLFANYVLAKDDRYEKEHMNRKFASYICKPRNPRFL